MSSLDKFQAACRSLFGTMRNIVHCTATSQCACSSDFCHSFHHSFSPLLLESYQKEHRSGTKTNIHVELSSLCLFCFFPPLLAAGRLNPILPKGRKMSKEREGENLTGNIKHEMPHWTNSSRMMTPGLLKQPNLKRIYIVYKYKYIYIYVTCFYIHILYIHIQSHNVTTIAEGYCCTLLGVQTAMGPCW